MDENTLKQILETPLEQLDIKPSYRTKLIHAVEFRRDQSPFEVNDTVLRVKDVFKIGLDRVRGTIHLGPLAFNAFVDYLTGLGVDVQRLDTDYKDLSGEPLKPLKLESVLSDLIADGVKCLEDYAKPRFTAESADLDVIVQAFYLYLSGLEQQVSQIHNASMFYVRRKEIEDAMATFEQIVGIKQIPEGNNYISSGSDDVEKNMQRHEERLKKYKSKPDGGQMSGGGLGMD